MTGPIRTLTTSRYYRITAYGRRVAQAEAARMRDLVQLAAARFGVPRHA